MKVVEALEGVLQLGLDTAPLIYYVEEHSRYVEVMQEIVEHIDRGSVHAVTSVVTLIEVLTHPLRHKNEALAERYRHLLGYGRNLSLRDITRPVAERTAALRVQYNLRTPDALQLAVALDAGCEAFLTNDRQLQRVTEMRVLLLDELEL